MAKEPRVVALVLCERMDVDPAVRRLSLSGVFHVLRAATWPTLATFTAYTALQGGRGEGTIELLVTRLETEEDVYRYRRWFAVPDPDLTVHVEIPVRRCVFPAPGRYNFSLRFDGVELTWRLLDVIERNSNP